MSVNHVQDPAMMTRRGFLTALGGTALLGTASLGTGMMLANGAESADRALTEHAKRTGLIDAGGWPEDEVFAQESVLKWKKDPERAQTIRYANKGGSAEISDAYAKVVKQHPFKTWWHHYFLPSLIEEIPFRLIPNRLHRYLYPEDQGVAPKTGIATTLVFGFLHNVDDSGKFIVNNIPLAQLFSGGVYWYLARRKNEGHSMVAHAIYNSLVWAMHFGKK